MYPPWTAHDLGAIFLATLQRNLHRFRQENAQKAYQRRTAICRRSVGRSGETLSFLVRQQAVLVFHYIEQTRKESQSTPAASTCARQPAEWEEHRSQTASWPVKLAVGTLARPASGELLADEHDRSAQFFQVTGYRQILRAHSRLIDPHTETHALTHNLLRPMTKPTRAHSSRRCLGPFLPQQPGLVASS